MKGALTTSLNEGYFYAVAELHKHIICDTWIETGLITVLSILFTEPTCKVV
jgi:hypothetical protein